MRAAQALFSCQPALHMVCCTRSWTEPARPFCRPLRPVQGTGRSSQTALFQVAVRALLRTAQPPFSCQPALHIVCCTRSSTEAVRPSCRPPHPVWWRVRSSQTAHSLFPVPVLLCTVQAPFLCRPARRWVRCSRRRTEQALPSCRLPVAHPVWWRVGGSDMAQSVRPGGRRWVRVQTFTAHKGSGAIQSCRRGSFALRRRTWGLRGCQHRRRRPCQDTTQCLHCSHGGFSKPCTGIRALHGPRGRNAPTDCCRALFFIVGVEKQEFQPTKPAAVTNLCVMPEIFSSGWALRRIGECQSMSTFAFGWVRDSPRLSTKM